MAFQQILSANGPLPLTVKFSSPVTGPVDFFVTSTAWTAKGAGAIGVIAVLDGKQLGRTTMMANNTSMHMTLPAMFATGQLSDIGGHVLELVAETGLTVTDLNDYFTVNIRY